MDHTDGLTCKEHHACLYLVSVHHADNASTDSGGEHLIAFIDLEMTKG